MKNITVSICLWFGALAAGCHEPAGAPARIGSAEEILTAGAPPLLDARGLEERGFGPTATAHVALWTEDGDVAIADAATGEIVSVAASGAVAERDVAWDPWESRLVTVEASPDAEGGEIASYSVDPGGALGPRRHEVWVDGIARVLASPFGAVVLEESYGERWRLASPGGPTPSVAAPRPMSIAVAPFAGGMAVRALTYGFGDDSLEIWDASVTADGVSAPMVTPLDDSASRWVPVRWVPVGEGGYLARVEEEEIAIAWLDPASTVTEIARLPAAGARVEAAAAVDPGTLILLVSAGGQSSGGVDVEILRFALGGEIGCRADIDLPGEVRQAFSFFSRDLLIVGPSRALVATTEGVFAIDVPAGCPVIPWVDAAFEGDALRGPMDLVVTPY